MKLSAHYNKASIIISVSVMLISGIVYYAIINHIARAQLDGDLVEELSEVVEYVNQYHKLPTPVDFDEDVTTFSKTRLSAFDTHFFDAPYHNPREEKSESGRAIAAMLKVNGQNYIVQIVESREATESLIQIISVITVVLTAVLLVVLLVTNRFVLKGLWKPFYAILHQLKKFNIASAESIGVMPSTVDEFNELNDAVSKMSARVTNDYQGLKVFTENASHEMMTPLAIINGKLDILIQDERLDAGQLGQITDIYKAANRLSRLNQGLLLLAKIDNELLNDTDTINLKPVILERAQQFHEMMATKNIDLTCDLRDCPVTVSKHLADVLINNLFSNAIRHNVNSGKISVTGNEEKLCFKNTGHPAPLDENAVFQRFYKSNKSEGAGLGLAILKNICTLYNFEIAYRFESGLHCFEVKFR